MKKNKFFKNVFLFSITLFSACLVSCSDDDSTENPELKGNYLLSEIIVRNSPTKVNLDADCRFLSLEGVVLSDKSVFKQSLVYNSQGQIIKSIESSKEDGHSDYSDHIHEYRYNVDTIFTYCLDIEEDQQLLHYYIVDGSGKIIKRIASATNEESLFKYDAIGNLIEVYPKVDDSKSNTSITIEYDDKPGMLKNIIIPQWVGYDLFDEINSDFYYLCLNNNVTKITPRYKSYSDAGIESIVYQYNEKGYPESLTWTDLYEETDSYSLKYSYK